MLKKLALFGGLLILLTLTSLTALGQDEMGDREINLPGLDGEVTVRFDDLGIPNIYATTTHDLVMAQGYVHATDRWWQMEWWRHQGAGTLSEISGSSLVGTDAFLRTVGTRRNAENDLANMDADTVAMLQAYADGVNAYIAGVDPTQLAVDYTYLNLLRTFSGVQTIKEVEPWTPLNTVTWLQIMALALNGNYDVELLRMQVIQQAGQDALDVLLPGYNYDTLPLITEPGWTPPAAEAALPQIKTLADYPGLEPLVAIRDAGLGSNSWTVSGALSETGGAILANDPHLGIQMPSIWYEIGLHCVEINDDCPYDVYGYSFAGNPLIIIGHNDHIAWGFTNVGTDVQDLYLLDVNPDNPLQYKVDGEWEDMDVINETIEAWDSEPIELPVRLTRFGPVVNDLFSIDQPMALRWGAADANRNTHAFELLNQATNWDEFQTAATYFDLAGQNWLYADVEGNIGYVTSGRIPIRAEGHDGSVPADGTVSDFEWQGFIDPMENPRIYNPESNYIITANNAVISPEDFEPVITVDWDYGYRASRIETMMQAQDVHSLDTFAAMQFDSYNSAATLMMPELTPVDFGDDRLNEAVAWLGEWDFQNAADSPQAALFNVFWNEFVPMVFDETQNYGEDYNVYRLSLMLNVPEHPMWNNGVMETADPVVFMQAALGNALDYMESEYGDDWDAWRWGDLHIARFRAAPLGQLPEGVNPTLDAALPQIFRLFNREVGVSGGPSIVNATSWSVGSGDYTVTGHPSMRMIVDLSDLDNSRFVIPTGESGNPQNPHYDDMMALWANGEYHTHQFSLEAVQAATVQTWTLSP